MKGENNMDKAVIETFKKYLGENAEINIEAAILINALKLMKMEISKESNKFLDSFDTHTGYNYQPPKLNLSFNGVTAEVPIDFCEYCNAVQELMDTLIEETYANYNV